jgi:hypothetical protein
MLLRGLSGLENKASKSHELEGIRKESVVASVEKLSRLLLEGLRMITQNVA